MITGDLRVFNFHCLYFRFIPIAFDSDTNPKVPVPREENIPQNLNSRISQLLKYVYSLLSVLTDSCSKTAWKCSAFRIWTNVFMNLDLTLLRQSYGASWKRAIKDWGHSWYKVGIFFIPVGCLILFSKTINSDSDSSTSDFVPILFPQNQAFFPTPSLESKTDSWLLLQCC